MANRMRAKRETRIRALQMFDMMNFHIGVIEKIEMERKRKCSETVLSQLKRAIK